MITLTHPNGGKLRIDPDKITLMEDVNPGEWAPSAKTLIRIDGENHAVRETVAEIDEMRK